MPAGASYRRYRWTMMHRSVCPGCKAHFEHANPVQKWCSIQCRNENKRRVQPIEYGPPMNKDVLAFRRYIRSVAPKDASGYRLYLPELDLWFPLPGRTLRWDGSFRSTRAYELHPVEPPRVPFQTTYQIGFVLKSGILAYPASPLNIVTVYFPQDMSNCRVLGAILKAQKRALQPPQPGRPLPRPRKKRPEIPLIFPDLGPPKTTSESPNLSRLSDPDDDEDGR
jgi:hypothetical protein